MTSTLLSAIENAALDAGNAVYKNHFRNSDLHIQYKEKESKSQASIVTAADLASGQIIRNFLGNLYPDYAYQTEENAQKNATTGKRFIIDEIDGTLNFARGLREWSVSIAATDETGVVVAGAIYFPALGEMFTAEKGKGAFLSSKQITLQGRDCFPGFLIGTSFSCGTYNSGVEPVMEQLKPLCAGIRDYSCFTYNLSRLALGHLDAYVQNNYKPWDIAASALILTEAGGKISPWRPNGDLMSGNQGAVASNAQIHDRLVKKVRESVRLDF